ncbi:MAG: inositol-1-monophosphatase [Gammaproteobacteria bacterium]|nr:inositol-1-monophosphatase [Gammaproteobacteria bacterium]
MRGALTIGVRAARKAGDLIVRRLEQVQSIPIDSKGRNDFVTEVDRQAEAVIIEIIRRTYPGHGFLAEESGLHSGDEHQWIIDPLDGTTNFLHGFPQFAVSIALRIKGRIEDALVYDPLRQELFTASRGRGATLNERRIRVSRQRSLDGALLGTGFPFRSLDHLEEYLAMFRALFPVAAGIRRAGAASLDLAYVACGRLDGFWEFGLKPWDIAAGALMIKEAGGIITDMDGSDCYLESGNVVAGNPKIVKTLCAKLGTRGRPR